MFYDQPFQLLPPIRIDRSLSKSVFLIESDIMGNDIYWSSSLDEMNSYFSACRADLAAFKGEGSEEAIVSGYFSS